MKLKIDQSYCFAMAKSLRSGKRRYVPIVKKWKKGIIISVGGNGANPDYVLPIFDTWSSEINLEIIDALCISEGQSGMLPTESEKTLEMAFQQG